MPPLDTVKLQLGREILFLTTYMHGWTVNILKIQMRIG